MPDENIIYAQVLLLDGKIENWKICQSRKDSPLDFKAYWKSDRINDYTMETKVFKKNEIKIEEGWNFNSYVYNVLGPQWINQFEYADDYKLGRCNVSTLEDYLEDLNNINKAFGGRFSIVGQLGKN